MLKNVLVMGTVLALAGTAMAHNGTRIYLTVEDGKLLTSLDTFVGAHNITPGVSVFKGMFGHDESAVPLFTQFPGLSGSVTAPTAVPAGSTVGFDIAGPLQFWNGAGSAVFSRAVETLSISVGADTVTSGAGAVPGLTLVAAVPTTDGWHMHPGYTLHGAPASVARDGVYALPLTLSNGGLTAPVWLVFGENVGSAVVDAGAAAVPEAGTLGVLVVGVAGLVGRRRRVGTR